MPEIDHVRGMTGHDDLPGPPRDPVGGSGLTDYDVRIGPLGDPDATSARYFLETKSTNLADIVTRTSATDPVPSVG